VIGIDRAIRAGLTAMPGASGVIVRLALAQPAQTEPTPAPAAAWELTSGIRGLSQLYAAVGRLQ
jgi:hypothetical protein